MNRDMPSSVISSICWIVDYTQYNAQCSFIHESTNVAMRHLYTLRKKTN